ncbi:MAG: hypothetical protein ACI4UE_01215 [Candidatus Scatovivens sp.]
MFGKRFITIKVSGLSEELLEMLASEITEESALDVLSTSKFPMVRSTVAANIYTSKKTRKKLMKDKHPDVVAAAEFAEENLDEESDEDYAYENSFDEDSEELEPEDLW